MYSSYDAAMIQLMHEQLNLSTGSPVKIKWCDYDHFKYPLHFHSEYEIVYILKSTGKRFVGNNIEPYADGDLVLLGSFVPHMYKSDPVYHQKDEHLRVHAIVLQFSKDLFPYAMEHYPEFYKIRDVLEKAQSGIYFRNCKKNELIRRRLKRALVLKNIDLLIECIKILSLMSETEEKDLLNEDYRYQIPDNQYQDPRIIKILSWVHNQYSEPLSLQVIAEKAGMNKAAFCRFFKTKTGKTCFEYITELRINFACKLLKEGNLPVTQICYETGFNNISNFNRQFKKITQFTPTNYLQEFKQAK